MNESFFLPNNFPDEDYVYYFTENIYKPKTSVRIFYSLACYFLRIFAGLRICFEFYLELILFYFLLSCAFIFRIIAGYVTKRKGANKRKRKRKKPNKKQS